MKFLKQLSLYTFVGFFNAGLSFLLMPYLSHYIDPAGYGILSMINSFVTILIPLVGLTAAGFIAVEFYRMKDKNEYASAFSSIQAIPILPGLLILLVTIFFPSQIARFLEIPSGKTYWIPLSVLIALLSIYYDTLMTYVVIEQKPVLYVKYSIVRVLMEVGLTVLFISIFQLSWEGRLLSWLIATMISFLISVYYFRSQRLLTLKIKRKYIRAGILFGLPLILHTIGKFVINQSDRIFIAKMVSIEEAGIYNIGYQVGMVILLFVNAVGNFFQPFLYQRLANLTESAKLEIVKTIYATILGLLFSLILLTLGAPLLFKLLIDKSYSDGLIYVFWTGLSYFFWGIYILFTGFIFYEKQTKQLGYLAILNVGLNVVLNYVLIQKFGALGAVYATCISFFVVAAIVVWRGSSLFNLPWFEFKKVLSKKNMAQV
ncbi:MAG TPA: oligosaccharide flippase family protein [Flavisolibacter sp.]|nr:oligosaccharide flippase family protein [Flavisolibacter sp.]